MLGVYDEIYSIDLIYIQIIYTSKLRMTLYIIIYLNQRFVYSITGKNDHYTTHNKAILSYIERDSVFAL